MKMSKNHLEYLRSKISQLDTQTMRDKYRAGNFARADKVKDINKRYRWDLLNYAVKSIWVCDELYPYLDNNHIDTALRNIVSPL